MVRVSLNFLLDFDHLLNGILNWLKVSLTILFNLKTFLKKVLKTLNVLGDCVDGTVAQDATQSPKTIYAQDVMMNVTSFKNV